MPVIEKQTIAIAWRPDYNAERLFVRDWMHENGWDFCRVDRRIIAITTPQDSYLECKTSTNTTMVVTV